MKPTMRIVLVGMGLVLIGCTRASEVKTSSHAERPGAINLARWLDAHPLPLDETFSIVELGKTDSSSMHLVQLRHQEVLHVHRSHDLVLVLERGYGTLQLGAQTLTMKPGDVVAIPRNAPHAFTNLSHQPAAELVVYSPPYDETDTISVHTKP